MEHENPLEIGTDKWSCVTSEVVGNSARQAKKVNFKDFETLPQPVARYLRFVLKENQQMIKAVRLIQQGEFLTRGWNPFEAEEYFSTDPPAFVWNAHIRMARMIPVKVRDAYVEGKGSMVAKIFRVVPLVHQQNAEQINVAALQRYLAECPWFPTALLPSDRLKWRELDSNRAMATITDSGIEASIEFHFNDIGEIVSIFTPGRYRYEDGQFVLTPWAGYFRNYREVHGMQIPMEAEVEWVLPEGRVSYFKGKIAQLEYDANVFNRFIRG